MQGPPNVERRSSIGRWKWLFPITETTRSKAPSRYGRVESARGRSRAWATLSPRRKHLDVGERPDVTKGERRVLRDAGMLRRPRRRHECQARSRPFRRTAAGAPVLRRGGRAPTRSGPRRRRLPRCRRAAVAFDHGRPIVDHRRDRTTEGLEVARRREPTARRRAAPRGRGCRTRRPAYRDGPPPRPGSRTPLRARRPRRSSRRRRARRARHRPRSHGARGRRAADRAQAPGARALTPGQR